jgi:hypothetical protein
VGLRRRTPEEHAAIGRAKARLDRLDLYPRPVSTRHVRIVHAPWFFRLPGLRRFDGWELGSLILLRRPLREVSDDLVVHELCHVWQLQQRGWRMPLSYLRGYARNRHEVEAREAVERTF